VKVTDCKSIISRTFRIGEEGAEDAGKTEEYLNSIGIAVRKSATEFRDFSGILDDIKGRWGSLTSTEKSALAQQMAGTWHYSKFIALMENYGIAQDATNKAMNSQNSALQENAKYMNSVAGKVGLFKVSLENLYSTILSSDALKNILDGLIKFIEVTNRVVTGLGGFNTALLLIINTLIIFKSKAIASAITSVWAYIAAFGLAETATLGFSAAVSVLNTALLALLKNPITWILAAVGTLTIGIFSWINANQKLKESIIETNKAQLDFNLAVKDFYQDMSPDKVNATAQAFENLKKQLNYKNDNDLQEDINKIQELRKESEWAKKVLSDSGRSSYEKNLAQKILQQLSDLEDKTKKYTEAQKELDTQKAITNILDTESQNNIAKKVKGKLSELDADKELIKQYEKSVKAGKEDKEIRDQILDKYPQYLKMIGEHSDKIGINTDTLKINIDIQETLAKAEIVEAQVAMRASLDKTTTIVEQTKQRITALKEEQSALVAISKPISVADVEISPATEIFNDRIEEKFSQIVEAEKGLERLQSAIEIQKGSLELTPEQILAAAKSGKKGYFSDSDGDKSSLPTLKEAVAREELTKELVKAYNKEVDISDVKIKHLERQLKINDEQKNYNRELELTNSLISNQEAKIGQLGTANKSITKEADKLRADNLKFDTTKWFDVGGEATVDYRKLLNSFAIESEKIRAKAEKTNTKTAIQESNKQIQALENQKKKIEELFNNIYALKKAYASNTDEILKTEDAVDSLKQSVVKLNEEQKKLQEELYKKQKKSLEEILDLVTEMIKQEAEDQIDALEEQVDKYKEIISAKKEALKLTEEQHDYEKSLAEKQKDISKIQNRLLELSLDDSRAAQAERLKLEEDLADKTSDLDELQHDRSIELQEQALDKELKQFEDTKDKEIKEIKDYLDKSGRLTADAMKLINTQGDTVYNNLVKWNELYGDSIENNVKNSWESAKQALNSYKNSLNQIDYNFASQTLSDTLNESDIIAQMQANSKSWSNASPEYKKELAAENLRLGTSIGLTRDDKTGIWYDKSGVRAYAGGGTSTETQLALLHGTKANPEWILNSGQMKSLITNLTLPQFKMPEVKGLSNGSGVQIGSLITVNGNVDKAAMPKLETVVNQAVDKLVNTMGLRGNTRSTKSYSI